MYPEGTEMAGIFFPQETAGKWWTNQPFGAEGEVGIVAGQGNNANNLLTTNVPFSKLQGYNVSNNPAALELAGQPQKEFILPDEYRANATVEPYPSKQPLNIEETLASFSDEEPITRATVKKKSKGAKKQFLEDLQKDPDYIDFRDKATIRNEEGKAVTSYGIPNSVSKDQFRNAGNTYDTIFDINAQEIQPEVKEIFSKNSGISEIGNENEYAQYVAETYPNHKLLYHGTESVTPFDEFNYNKEGTHSGSKQAAWWRLDENAWYDQNKDLSQIPQEIGDRIFPVALDTTDYIKGNDFLIAEYLDIPEEIYSEIYNSNKNATDDFKKLAITFYNDGTKIKI